MSLLLDGISQRNSVPTTATATPTVKEPNRYKDTSANQCGHPILSIERPQSLHNCRTFRNASSGWLQTRTRKNQIDIYRPVAVMTITKLIVRFQHLCDSEPMRA